MSDSVNINLSPGEWAGVLDVLREKARELRDPDGPVSAVVDDQPDAMEIADDYDRIAAVIRAALAENGRTL